MTVSLQKWPGLDNLVPREKPWERGCGPDRFFDGSVPNFLCRVNGLYYSALQFFFSYDHRKSREYQNQSIRRYTPELTDIKRVVNYSGKRCQKSKHIITSEYPMTMSSAFRDALFYK